MKEPGEPYLSPTQRSNAQWLGIPGSQTAIILREISSLQERYPSWPIFFAGGNTSQLPHSCLLPEVVPEFIIIWDRF